MSKLGLWLISPWLLLPLAAQENPVLPEGPVPPPVDMITPVPAPDIPIGGEDVTRPAMPESLKIENQGGRIEGSVETGVRFGGPVKITGDNGMEIFANTAVLDLKAKTVTLEGDVSVYQGNMLQRGRRAVYYYERGFLDAGGLRASVDPILMEAGKFTFERDAAGNPVFTGTDAGITTHDVENPNFWVRAAETRVYPGDRVTFKNLRLYAGDTPVFWLPYLSQPLDAELGYHFVPGARSNWGPYLLNTYGIMLGGNRNPETGENEDAWLLSRWRFDIRSRRGLGTGVDLLDIRQADNPNLTGLSLYYLYDSSPDTRRSGRPVDPDVDHHRYRIEWKQRHGFDMPDGADWRADADLTLLSDGNYLDDFEPQLFRNNPFPDNTLGVYRRDETTLLSLFTRLRVNDFHRSDTRLPELALDKSLSPVFGSPLLYEGSSSFGILSEKPGDGTRRSLIDPLLAMAPGDPNAPRLIGQLEGFERTVAERISALPLGDPRRDSLAAQLLDSGFTRFHTYHELSMPARIGALNLTPQAGVGYTRYDGIDGPLADFDRLHLHAGAEASMKFSKSYDDFVRPEWGAGGLTHVFQPYVNWSLVSTDSTDPTFLGIDRLTPTTRPHPWDPARYTAIDELQSWNILRLGTRHRLLTRRDGQSHEWLFLNTYVDAFVDDPWGSRTFSNLYNELRWQPVPWMTLEFDTQFPVASGGSGFNEVGTQLRFLPRPDFEFAVGHRYLSGHPVLLDSNRVNLDLYKRINENWGIGSRHVVEFDDGTLEVQQYTLHRDLGNWVAGVGFTHRDNRVKDEYGVIFSLTLKDFPSVNLPFKLDAE
jgi:LPS-assembly protein